MFKGLVGKDISSLDGDTLLFNESMLFDFNMGYYNARTLEPFSSAEYRKESNDYYHPWSIRESGRFYGLNRLKDTISLKDFMTFPNCHLTELLEGVSTGETERHEMDQAQETRGGQSKLASLDPALKLALKEAGLDISKLA